MYVYPATPRVVDTVARNLRHADRNEVYAATGHSPEDVVPRCARASTKCYALYDRSGDPFAIYGIADWTLPHEITKTGAPWMLSTDGIEDEWLPFLRECRNLLDELAAGYQILSNYVHAENTLHKKWLAYWMKFALEEPVPWGPFGAPFNRFTKRNYKTCVLTPQRQLHSAQRR